jgi:flagellar protein FlgJ
MALKIDPPANNPLAARKDAGQAPSATDFHQFAALRRAAGAHDPKALREVARQFESIFTKMVMDSMRSASFGDSLFGSDQVDQYQGMMDDQLAVQLSQGKGLGLADMLVRQLQGGAAGAATEGVAPTPQGNDTARNVTPEQRRDFVDKLLPQATAAARELGVDPRAIVAQAALETGWGTHLPADGPGGDTVGSNNYFGIKAGGAWNGASVAADTTEFTAGVAGTERARFRAYGSVAENVNDYVRLLRDNPRYAAALGTGSDVRAFATALQRGGYATDPDYASKLMSVVGQVSEQLQARAGRQDIAAAAPPDVNQFKPGEVSPIATSRINNA